MLTTRIISLVTLCLTCWILNIYPAAEDANAHVQDPDKKISKAADRYDQRMKDIIDDLEKDVEKIKGALIKVIERELASATKRSGHSEESEESEESEDGEVRRLKEKLRTIKGREQILDIFGNAIITEPR